MPLKLFLILSIIACKVYGQDYGVEYWQMRQRLLDKFVVVGDCHGCSIPASKRDVEETGQDVLCYLDESIRHIGWYIAVLASEYRLLTLQDHATNGTVMELYYALNAIVRLDKYSEFILYKEIDPNTAGDDEPSPYQENLQWDNTLNKYKKLYDSGTYPNNPTFSDLNGFMMREDVPPFFGDNFNPPCKVRHGYGPNDGWITEQGVISSVERPNRLSQDQFFHLLIGLSFVTKYVPPWVTYKNTSLNQMAKSICELIMSRYSTNFKLIDPMTDEVVRSTGGEVIGDSRFYASMLAVAANKIINDVNISNQFDLLSNPYVNSVALASHLLWGPTTMFTAYQASTFTDNNSAMPLQLTAISNALEHDLSNTSVHLLAFGANYGDFKGVGYKIYGNMYNLLNDKDVAILGYTKPEMVSMLEAITCEGPHWMNYSKAFSAFNVPSLTTEQSTHSDIVLECINHINYYTVFNNEIQPWLESHNNLNGSIFFRKTGSTSVTPEYHWIESENPVWNRDNIFAQLPSEIYERSHYRGHYNALDFMLLHNIYKLSQFEGKSGFEIIPSHPTSFLQEYCGVDCTISQELPFVYQHSMNINNCQLFLPPVQLGTEAYPYIRSSLGLMTIDQTIGPRTINISSNNIGTNICEITTEPTTYIPKAIYYAVEGFDFSSTWHPHGDIYVDFNYLPDCQYVYHERVSSPKTALTYNVIDHSLINKDVNKKSEQKESFEAYPNPFENSINVRYYSDADKGCALRIIDSSGKIIFENNSLLFSKGENKISIPLEELSRGIYNIVINFEETYISKRIIKL